MIIHLPKTCSIFTITPDPSTILLGTWTLWQEFRVKGLGWGFWAVVIYMVAGRHIQATEVQDITT